MYVNVAKNGSKSSFQITNLRILIYLTLVLLISFIAQEIFPLESMGTLKKMDLERQKLQTLDEIQILTFIENNAHIHLPENLGLGQLLRPIVASYLLIGGEDDIDGPDQHETRSLELSDRLQVLHPDALHVLRPPREDSPFPIKVRPEGRVGPLRVLHGHDIGVGVEHDGGESRACARPFYDDDGLPVDKLDGLGLKGEGARLGEDEVRRLAVIGFRLRSIYAEVFLEAGDDQGRVLGGGEWRGKGGKEDQEED